MLILNQLIHLEVEIILWTNWIFFSPIFGKSQQPLNESNRNWFLGYSKPGSVNKFKTAKFLMMIIASSKKGSCCKIKNKPNCLWWKLLTFLKVMLTPLSYLFLGIIPRGSSWSEWGRAGSPAPGSGSSDAPARVQAGALMTSFSHFKSMRGHSKFLPKNVKWKTNGENGRTKADSKNIGTRSLDMKFLSPYFFC